MLVCNIVVVLIKIICVYQTPLRMILLHIICNVNSSLGVNYFGTKYFAQDDLIL